MDKKMDPELLRQLDSAELGGTGVEAVFSLRRTEGAQRFTTPEETESLVAELIQRLSDETGESPSDYNVFRNLGSFVVAASPHFVRRLLDQDEIDSALANRQP